MARLRTAETLLLGIRTETLLLGIRTETLLLGIRADTLLLGIRWCCPPGALLPIGALAAEPGRCVSETLALNTGPSHTD